MGLFLILTLAVATQGGKLVDLQPSSKNLYEEKVESNICEEGQSLLECSEGEVFIPKNPQARLGVFLPSSSPIGAGTRVIVGIRDENGFLDSITGVLNWDSTTEQVYAVYPLPAETYKGDVFISIESASDSKPPLTSAIQFALSGINIGNGGESGIASQSNQTSSMRTQDAAGSEKASDGGGCSNPFSIQTNSAPSNEKYPFILLAFTFILFFLLRKKEERAAN